MVCYDLLWFVMVCYGLLWQTDVVGLLWFATVEYGLFWLVMVCLPYLMCEQSTASRALSERFDSAQALHRLSHVQDVWV